MKKTMGLISICAVLLLSSCTLLQNNPPDYAEVKQELFAMDTVITVTAYGEHASKAIAQANKELMRLDDLLSVTDSGSDVSKINQNAGKKTVISKDTFHILQTAEIMSQRTNGLFDISVYPLVREWGFTTDRYKVPSEEKIKSLLKAVDYKQISLNQKESAVTTGAEMEIDLGGIAKGYSAQRLSDVIKQNGVSSAVISLGGNVQTVGQKPDGGDWNVAVEYPDNKKYFATLRIGEGSVITSGAYQRYFEKDGVLYHHILDPRTGKPSHSGLKSTTVICKDPTQGDALSTALFIMGTEQAQRYYKNVGGLEYILLTDSNEVYITQGIKDSFTLTDEFRDFKIHVVSP